MGGDEAVSDGKSKGCLMLVELELETCWDWHPCLSPSHLLGGALVLFACKNDDLL